MSTLGVRVRKRLPGFELDTAWSARAGFTVLFGYSGAGKSLTLATVTGALKPDVGRIVLGERVLCDTEAGIWVPPQQRRVGFVSQGAQLFPHMSVVRNVEYALHARPRRSRRAEALAMLERLHVADLAEKRPAQISGGQRQRVALARALVSAPELLVLDEPFSGLDLPLRMEMGRLVKGVQQEFGVPVVMVTHDIIEAMSLADTLVVYSGTGVVQYGRPAEVHADPATPEIRRLLHAVDLPASLTASRGTVHRLPTKGLTDATLSA